MPFSRAAFVFVLLLLAGAPAHAQEATTQELRLTALGGVSLQVPVWKELRKDAAVAVFEQAPEPAAQKPYYVLMCSLEEGPAAGAPVPWDKIRDNMMQAASKNGRNLTLEVKEPFTGAASFEARRLVGEFQSPGAPKKVGIELLALVKDGKLLTIGLVAEALAPPVSDMVQAIAKSARLGP